MNDIHNQKAKEVYCPLCKITVFTTELAPLCHICRSTMITTVKSLLTEERITGNDEYSLHLPQELL